MANTKIYQIQINGLTESVKAVDALSDSLQFLDKKIKELEHSSVNIKTNSSGGGNVKALQTEDALLKQIRKTEQDIVNTRREEYQQLLADKELLKETKNIQEQRAASERLAASNYGNTMQGLKQELADIKSVMQTTNLDSGAFSDMTKRAGELTTKLKELEASYGQFGRNVGNYQSAFDGMEKITLTISGVSREFNSAREASKTLKNELIGLETAGSGNTEVAKELRTEYYKLQSAMDDATKSSKAMDVALDTMQSFTAMASIGTGIKGFFGFDDNEIQKSIQRMVALQGALKGIESIKKQIETGEGLGGIFSKSYESVDKAANKLLVYNRALLGTGTAAKAAEVGIKGLTVAAKAFASIGIVAIISAAAWAIQKVTEAVSDWVKGNADLVSSEKMLKATIESTNQTLEKELKLIEAKHSANLISSIQKQIQEENAYGKAIAQTNEELKNRLKYNTSGANSTFSSYALGSKTQSDIYKDKGVTTLGGFTEAIKDSEELTKRYEALSEAVGKNTELVYKNAKGIEIAHLSASDAKDELNHLDQMLGGNLVRSLLSFDTATETGREGLKNFVNGIQNSDSKLYKSLLLRLPEVVSSEAGPLGDALRAMLSQITNFVNLSNAELNKVNFEGYVNSLLDSADKSGKRMYDRQKKELNDRYNSLSKEEQKAQKANFEAGNAALDKMQAERNKKISNSYKKEQKTVQAAENELTRLRIAQMKEGLNKTITQLEEERKAKIAKIKLDGKMVGELTLETNKYYDKQIEDAKKDHAEKVEQIYKDMWAKINADELANIQKQKQNLEDTYESIRKTVDTKGKEDRTTSSYGIQGKNQFSPQTRQSLGIVSENKSEFMTEMKQYIDMYREYNTLLSKNTQLEAESLNITGELSDKEVEIAKLQVEYARKEEEALKNRNEKYKNYLINKYGEIDVIKSRDALIKESYSSDLSSLFNERMTVIEAYWKLRKDTEIKGAKEVYKAEIAEENKRYANESASTKAHYDDIAKQIGDNIEKGLIPTVEEASAMFLANQANYQKADEELRKEHEKNAIKIEEDKNDKIKRVNSEYYQDALQELRDFQTATNNLEQKQPVVNSWGIVNLKETKKNNENLRKSYEEQLKKIAEKRNQINEEFNKVIIDKDEFDATIRELDNAANSIGEKLNYVGKDLVEQWWGSINQWVQVIGQSASNILGSIGDIVSNGYEKQINAQEKYIDKLSEMYDKQKDITQQYADDVNGIEDELSNARGDRRQQLIDQLNTQMAAQRASLAEEKRIEKEQEKAEKKKKKLEHDQAVAEKKMSLWQAGINAAMAVSMAAVNHWPVPAIPMMAMAAAVGAAQIAAVASKPIPSYGSGGVIEGKSHAAGGVKAVVANRNFVELEGNEFIIRKATATQNVDLLDYINKSQKKLTLSDFVDFYGNENNKVKSNIQHIKTKFADGGQIPTLRNDISLNNGLLTAMEDYANRNVVVQVVDIVNATERLNNVKVMAGLLD